MQPVRSCLPTHPGGPELCKTKASGRVFQTMASLTAAALMAMALAACDQRAESSPGSSPAAIGSASTSGKTATEPSSGVEVRTPSTGDIKPGGSSGSKGVPAIPDTSGGPTAGGLNNGQPPVAVPPTAGAAPGSATSGTAPIPGANKGSAINAGNANRAGNGAVQGGTRTEGALEPRPSGGTTNGGVPASVLCGSGANDGNSNSNSTPQSNTGNR